MPPVGADHFRVTVPSALRTSVSGLPGTFGAAGDYLYHSYMLEANNGSWGLFRVQADVVAITRSPEKLAAFSSQGVDVRPGDFKDRAGLEKAFSGIERLLIIPGSDLTPDVRPRSDSYSGIGQTTE